MATRARADSGFSLIELMISTAVLLIISSIVTSALLQMTKSQTTVWNRTEMHSGIRGATELLQQEVGQAGKVSVPAPVTLGAAVGAAASCDQSLPGVNAITVSVSSAVGLYASGTPPEGYELLTTFDGDNQEVVKLAAVNTLATPNTITACFTHAHGAGTVLIPMGGFATGILPPTGVVNGSSGTVLKMYGDINGDGNMVYVEYTCDTTAHNLYRNVMAYDAATKPAVTNSQILLSNIVDNPGGTPCFTYQTASLIAQGTSFTFVLDVAVTLTVQTQQRDPVTNEFQTETKALLNVSPRNVFNAWMLASIGYTDHLQSTPATVVALLPPVP